MSDTIEFFFDLSSPYGYLAACRVREIEKATGKTVVFKPYLMGAVFKVTGRQPLANHPLIWDYARKDIKRSARKINVPLKLPDPFPVATASACRAFYWVQQNEGIDAARELAHALYSAYFVDGQNIGNRDVVVEVIADKTRNETEVIAALNDDTLKQSLRQVTESAAQRGIFGSPFFVVDEESFWGHDRINDVIEWSTHGGW